jgi:hypothetical protein
VHTSSRSQPKKKAESDASSSMLCLHTPDRVWSVTGGRAGYDRIVVAQEDAFQDTAPAVPNGAPCRAWRFVACTHAGGTEHRGAPGQFCNVRARPIPAAQTLLWATATLTATATARVERLAPWDWLVCYELVPCPPRCLWSRAFVRIGIMQLPYSDQQMACTMHPANQTSCSPCMGCSCR